MAKKGRVVFSVGPSGAASSRSQSCSRCRALPCRCEPSESREPARQKPRVRRERAGRKGRTVTVVAPLLLLREDATLLLSELKKCCGGGGTLKLGQTREGVACFVLELQGDHADRVTAELESRGYAAKRSGG